MHKGREDTRKAKAKDKGEVKQKTTIRRQRTHQAKPSKKNATGTTSPKKHNSHTRVRNLETYQIPQAPRSKLKQQIHVK